MFMRKIQVIPLINTANKQHRANIKIHIFSVWNVTEYRGQSEADLSLINKRGICLQKHWHIISSVKLSPHFNSTNVLSGEKTKQEATGMKIKVYIQTDMSALHCTVCNTTQKKCKFNTRETRANTQDKALKLFSSLICIASLICMHYL